MIDLDVDSGRFVVKYLVATAESETVVALGSAVSYHRHIPLPDNALVISGGEAVFELSELINGKLRTVWPIGKSYGFNVRCRKDDDELIRRCYEAGQILGADLPVNHTKEQFLHWFRGMAVGYFE